MNEYNKDLCEKTHLTVDEKLENHENRMDGHSKRIEDLEKNGRVYETKIEDLCDQIKNLISTIKWGLGIFVTVSIFIIGFILKK